MAAPLDFTDETKLGGFLSSLNEQMDLTDDLAPFPLPKSLRWEKSKEQVHRESSPSALDTPPNDSIRLT